MKSGMSLQTLLETVIKQTNEKRDFVTSTKDNIRMVDADSLANGVGLVLLREGAEQLERFSISETCHKQIAYRLKVPANYYMRLLADHKDLVIHQVNALFEREPKNRLVRVLGDTARAFLSDRYRPLDNDTIIERALPPIVKGDIQSELLSSNVGENHMHIKVLFTGDDLAMDVGDAPHGQGRDIVRPGALISNSETGMGGFNVSGFFYRSFCRNGCVFGKQSIFDYTRRHLGAKLQSNGDFEIFTDETKRMQDELIVAEISDAMKALTNAENVQKMANTLRATKEGEQVKDAFAAVDTLAKELNVRDPEKESVIKNLLMDGDFSRWGMLNAVTKIANSDDVSYERACELEQIGASIIDLNRSQWTRIATAERVAA